MRVQAKLAVGSPDDEYEREADRVAEEITLSEDASVIQRKCARCSDEDDELPQTKEASDSGPTIALGSRTQTAIKGVLNSPGQQLDAVTRSLMEPRFSHDFSRVRVHADARAAESAQAVNARAFTVGQKIVFGAGQYAPDTQAGRRLIAHELAHVMQQNGIHSRENVGVLRRLHPAAVGAAAAGAFAVGFVGAATVDYLLMTRERSERYARSLDTLYPGWLSALPNCPCEAPASDTRNWVRDSNPDLQTYHPGAASSFRSTSAATGGSRHGQQCTYDAANCLITSGPAAGTPDVYSPSWGLLNIPYHIVYDVKPWKELGWSTYNMYWRPNNGLGCPSNGGGSPAP